MQKKILHLPKLIKKLAVQIQMRLSARITGWTVSKKQFLGSTFPFLANDLR
jgi:hypothetical protein